MRSVMAFSTLVVLVVAVVWLAMRPTTPQPVGPVTRGALPETPAAPTPPEPPPTEPVVPPVETPPPAPTPPPAEPEAPPLVAPTPPVGGERTQLPPVALPTPTALPPPPRPTVDRHGVQSAVRAAKPGVVDCYRQALERNPELGGTLRVRFTVARKDGTGRIRDAEIADEGLGNPFFEMCVLTALGEMEYPAPDGDGEVVVTYPFNLQPSGGGD